VWQFIRYLANERLIVRLMATQTIKLSAAGIEVHLAPDETMWPERIDGTDVTEHGNRAHIIGASEKDQAAVWADLQIQAPAGGDRPPRRRGCEALTAADASRGDEPIGTRVKSRQRLMMETAPDFLLPAAIDIFDGVLESVLTWRSEDGCHAETETQTHDAAHHIPVLMRPLKPRVIVELGIRWEADRLPMRQQRCHRRRRGENRARPRADQATMQRDAVEHFNMQASLNDQAFHEIEAIEFCAARRHLGQVPAGWGSWTPDAPLRIEDAPAFENAMDRADGRTRELTPVDEGPVNRGGAVVAQIAGRPQFLTQRHDAVFQRHGRPPRNGRRMRQVVPVDTIQTRPPGAAHPALHGREADVMGPSNSAHRDPASNGLDHPLALLRGAGFLLMLILENISIPRAYGSCRSRGRPERAHRSLQNARTRFAQLPQASSMTLIS
jgi:hypothetical protein